MAEKPSQIDYPAGPSGTRDGHLGQAFAECPTFAASISTPPSCQAHPQRNRRPLSRQILQSANSPPVTAGGLDIAPGTPSTPPSNGCDCPAPVAVLRIEDLKARSKHPSGIFHQATPASSHSRRQARPKPHDLRQSPYRAVRHPLVGVGCAGCLKWRPSGGSSRSSRSSRCSSPRRRPPVPRHRVAHRSMRSRSAGRPCCRNAR